MGQHKHKLVILLTCVWLVSVLLGLRALWAYAATPGRSGKVSPVLATPAPAHSADGRAVLVLFLHPQCPCSGATLEELAKIIARCGEQLEVKVIAVKPKNAPAEWEQTALLKRARTMPGVTVSVDDSGEQAQLLGVETSGHANLYDAAGGLLFSGGITSARGHSGDNAGSDAIVDFVQYRAAGTARTDVYGCSLALDAPAGNTGVNTCPK